MNSSDDDPNAILGRPLELPCGVRLKNRLIKAAMSDSLGDGAGNPTEAQMRLYERWAEGGAALSIIGEVQGSPRYPEKPGNLVLGPGADMPALRALAKRGSAGGAQVWPQLGHAGALAHAPISEPRGPSPLDVGGLRCEGMSPEDIRALPDAFARSAGLAQEAGFGGVQLHAGHGFLFSQFLSPLFNRRTDAYGGPIERRFRIIGEVIEAVRQAVGPSFPVGIKINATDRLVGGLTEAEALEVVDLLDRTSIDLIDVSGGTYFPGAASSSDGASRSGPYFIDFARRARAVTSVPIMLTGGFGTREQAAAAVGDGAADAVGLARAMALDPSLASGWLSDGGGDPAFPVFGAPPPGGVTAWYSMRLTALGEDAETRFDMSPAEALDAYEARDAERCESWLERFGRG
ncbi:NADH:flavin oxidoreductase/NADH oxidase family protein [Paralimibaculum aggregatum]|uniref:NADH:flavin oxidoreductase/NADH oxidase family protein n=1 Tax=Paralimibaculum aggregatum TaxID=3036245 RepID=A0ABQ6LRA5_9RHOB|nr:oxidoreductase [Limibaculum sp. NKW23]GMG83993.1 NADH:flavin oxidoreductase/NADH oxidase family protein [Limibaculum sp. NKW23]